MLTDFQISMKLVDTTDLEEAKKYCKMLIPTLTEEVQQMAEEIISIQ